jgi:hypothetical protein
MISRIPPIDEKKNIRYTYHGYEALGESDIGLVDKELVTSAAAAVDGTQLSSRMKITMSPCFTKIDKTPRKTKITASQLKKSIVLGQFIIYSREETSKKGFS